MIAHTKAQLSEDVQMYGWDLRIHDSLQEAIMQEEGPRTRET